MSSYIWRVLTHIISAYIYYVCSIVWWMFAFLYDVCLPILCLATCVDDVWFPVWYNALVPVSSYLYDVCLPIWCLPICVMSAYLYDVCLPIWCLPICVMSASLYDVCLPIWWLPICVMSAYLYDVCLPVWHLLKMMSAYLYCVLLLVWRLFNCIVLDTKSQNIPEVVIVGAGRWGSGNLGRVGQLEEGWGKRGQFTSNLRGRWTIPVTTGGCQVSEREYKGVYKGVQGGNSKGQEKTNRSAPCICCVHMCLYRLCKEWLDHYNEWMS
jgi:hypothetical protein